ncbi:hypothetical protein BHU09_03130 [Tannerella sp. oral taxon 808]|nr:hypothetical protein BHU09_03130 [Tannerella sp. oral taxon 808]
MSVVVLLCLSLAATLQAQTPGSPPGVTKVFLEHADVQSFDKEVSADRQVLSGNVQFRHDNSYMYCDSAYFYEANSSLEAFGEVRMEQGDTLFVYGDYLYYDGNIRMAKMRDNVRMESVRADGSIVTLFTDSLNYDRVANIGYYFDGGTIVDEANELSSYYGQYSPATRIAVFNDSVRVFNDKFVLYSDTLQYSTESKVATILGPSVIVSDSGNIYTSRGWYNTVENTSLLLDRSQVTSGNRILIGDSIAYNRAIGFGEAYGNVILRDTTEKMMLEGNYGSYDERTRHALATDSARCMEYSQGDTLYMHADTFEMITIDSTARQVKAYHGVRFFRVDIQGVCDSMQFNTIDSTLCMYADPVLWNEQNQLYGDTIVVHMADTTVDHVHVIRFAFSVQQVDTGHFNQLKGNDLKAYFEGREVRRIDIDGNAESIFFPIEDDGSMIGMNETKSSYLTIWVKDRKIEKLRLWPSPQGTLTPLPDLTPGQMTLRDFHWFDYLRPKDKNDIYTAIHRKTEDAAPTKRSDKFH